MRMRKILKWLSIQILVYVGRSFQTILAASKLGRKKVNLVPFDSSMPDLSVANILKWKKTCYK